MISETITTLYIDNMTCVNCENIIEHALTGREGIENVKASYLSGTVIITYDASKIDLEKIKEQIEEHDYNVRRENEKSASERNSVDIMNIASIGIIILTIYLILKRFKLTTIFNYFPIAREGMGYSMLFIIGILTSMHCVAMCGGICITQCTSKGANDSNRASKFSMIRPSLLYNLGRVASYTAVGGIVGAIGSVVNFSGVMKGIVQILAGVFMVIMGLNMLHIFPWLRKLNPRIPKIFSGKIYNRRAKSNRPFYIGILNGLMPCGPLQAMQLYALSTGDPMKGAFSMFLFSIGTFPLMFLFGALSSLLSNKLTGKMMKASAMLVLVMGVFMFNSGIVLSGLSFSILPYKTSTAKEYSIATIEEGIQTVTTDLHPGSYEPIVVQRGVPVKWTIKAETGDVNGCNNNIVVPKFNIQQDLSVGNTVIEFTPVNSGTFSFSCWMGMIRSKITVVDDLSLIDASTIS